METFGYNRQAEAIELGVSGRSHYHWRNSVSISGGLPWWYGDVLMKFWGVANVLQPPPKILGGCNPLPPGSYAHAHYA
jgi:hypothetical protein